MEAELIPGLPDDMGRECLFRVPYADFRTVGSVCKQWRRELESSIFHFLRRSNGHARSIVAIIQSQPIVTPTSEQFDDPTAGNKSPFASSARATNYRLTLFDPSTASSGDTWMSVPPTPALPLFCRVASVGTKLVVVGGWDPLTWAATDAVYVYDLLSATWRRGAPMPGPARSFFGCAASDGDGLVVVAGGHDDVKNALRSAMTYDVAGDRWATLPDMVEERDECGGFFLKGKFYAVGGYRTESQGVFSTSAEAFDFRSWEWGPVEELLESATCPIAAAAVVGDEEELYACGGGHVSAFDGMRSTWRKLAELPEDMKAASQMIAVEGGRLMVVGPEKHGGAQVSYLLEDEDKKGKGLTWKKLCIPFEYSGYVQAASSLQI